MKHSNYFENMYFCCINLNHLFITRTMTFSNPIVLNFSTFLQVRSRSLNHLDTLEHSVSRQSCDSVAVETDISGGPLKDSLSEPDCTMSRPGERLLTVPPQDSTCSSNNLTTDKSRVTTTGRRQMLSRSQVIISLYIKLQKVDGIWFISMLNLCFESNF